MMEFVPPRFVASVIGLLRIQAECRDEKVQIRVLQALQMAITPKSLTLKRRAYALELVSNGTILAAVGICVRFFDTNSSSLGGGAGGSGAAAGGKAGGGGGGGGGGGLTPANSMLHSAAFAALRQLVTFLFDHVQALARAGLLLASASAGASASASASQLGAGDGDAASSGGGSGEGGGNGGGGGERLLCPEAQDAYLLFRSVRGDQTCEFLP